MIGDVLQPTHLIFILVVALLVLGPKRLPEVGRSLGKGIRDFRGALSGITDPEATSPPGEDAQQVMPVTPATTAFSDEESSVVPAYPTASEEPVSASSASGESAVSSFEAHSVSPLPPHIEPDDPQPVAPAAKPADEH